MSANFDTSVDVLAVGLKKSVASKRESVKVRAVSYYGVLGLSKSVLGGGEHFWRMPTSKGFVRVNR